MKMKKLILACGLLTCAALSHASASQDGLTKKAMKGDYQAQRNLAWSYVNPGPEEKADPVLGCAWYLVILQSGSPKVHDGDRGNAKVYCDGKLDRDSQTAAMVKSRKLVRQIYGK